jgi:glycosyltransferase involved in cell wall biosynthesis
MDAAPPEPDARPRVLFISADPVGEEMAGLGIRYWELARVLCSHARVTVAHGGTQRSDDGHVRTLPFEPHRPLPLRALIDDADFIVTHPQWPLLTRWLRHASARVIFDLYDPETLETLELLAGRAPLLRGQLTATTLDRLHDALRTGHHFMCASEKQRDLWLGAMLALRLISPDAYDRDPSFRSVIDLVPFGVPDQPPPASTAPGPRETIAGLDAEAELVLWNGGIWSWLDAETAIRAAVLLAERRPQVRLVFMGVTPRHPAAAASTEAALAVARRLGALGSVVHFHEGWIPYEQRGTWLAQSNCALSAQTEHLETRFAYRTRVLDCFWGGLPVVCTAGDDLAAYIDREDLGAVAPTCEVQALSDAIEHVLDRGRDAYAQGLRAAAAKHTWSREARPLMGWIESSTPPNRPGDAPGVLRPPVGQRLRDLAYRLGGRTILARHR